MDAILERGDAFWIAEWNGKRKGPFPDMEIAQSNLQKMLPKGARLGSPRRTMLDNGCWGFKLPVLGGSVASR